MEAVNSYLTRNISCFLTQSDVLAFKIEVFENHNNLASFWCRLCPSAHLTSFNIIPNSEYTSNCIKIKFLSSLQLTTSTIMNTYSKKKKKKKNADTHIYRDEVSKPSLPGSDSVIWIKHTLHNNEVFLQRITEVFIMLCTSFNNNAGRSF